ncbi:RolB family protein [Bradyrhizobium sp. Cp5.3]|uniref:RolB family protein n=1 Tax=Bradyrhizobium sp. Cp5.3 TaxID=443598 RepID=UPI0009FF655C|nr:RolB family protein [Bradyrhizobium sp. Cp5.3]
MANNCLPYNRLEFGGSSLVQVEHPDQLQGCLREVLARYRIFVPYVLTGQRAWVFGARELERLLGSPEKDYQEFAMRACVNHPLDGYIEYIQSAHPDVLYVYMPVTAARNCFENQTLSHIPSHFGDVVLATEIPPYRFATNVEDIVRPYRDRDQDVRTVDVQRFVAVPRTDRFVYDGRNAVWVRTKQGPIDVLAYGRVMFWNAVRMPEKKGKPGSSSGGSGGAGGRPQGMPAMLGSSWGVPS